MASGSKTAPPWRGVAAVVIATVALVSLPAAAETVLTVVGHWTGWQAEEFQRNAAEYMRQNPDVRIEFIEVHTDREEGVAKLLLLLGSETTRPDIVHAYTAVVPELLQAGVFSPMIPQVAAEAQAFFFPQMLAGVSFQGQLYGIPTENQTYGLVYNQSHFADSGLGDPPATWDELRVYAQRLTRANPDGFIERYGLSMDSHEGWTFIQFAHTLLSMIWSNGGDYVTPDGRVLLNSIEVAETLTFLSELVQLGVVTTEFNVGTGRTAMSFAPVWRRQAFKASDLISYDDLRSVLIPANRGTPTTYQYGWGFFVTEQSPHKQEAWRFLRWLTMEPGENGQTRMGRHMAQLGSLPTNPSDLSAFPEFLEDPFYAGFVAGLDVARAEPLLPQMSRRQEAIATLLGPVVMENVPVVGALEQAQRRIEQILTEARGTRE